jgi:hypothetical protein
LKLPDLAGGDCHVAVLECNFTEYAALRALGSIRGETAPDFCENRVSEKASAPRMKDK